MLMKLYLSIKRYISDSLDASSGPSRIIVGNGQHMTTGNEVSVLSPVPRGFFLLFQWHNNCPRFAIKALITVFSHC